MTDSDRDPKAQGRPRIAVDAMGGDHGPEVAVPGALAALSEGADCELLFYGDRAVVEAQVAAAGGDAAPVSVVHCSENIAMSESPATAVRSVLC